MEGTTVKDWRPFVYGGLASIVAELGIKFKLLCYSLYSELKCEFFY